uniref:TrkA family potassium uptake protein n=1 Tax=Ignisphaera aggregans TaxID=334771 RepID=A0A7J3ZAY3_9CREN
MRFLIIGSAKDVLELLHILRKSPSNRREFIVLTDNQKDVELITRQIDIAVFSGDLFDENLYLEAGLRNVDVIVAMHENDMVNVFASMLAKEYNLSKIIAVVNNKTVAKILRSRGVTEWVIERSSNIGEKIRNYVLGFDLIEFGDNAFIMGKAENLTKLIGKAIKELESEGVKVLAIVRDNVLLELKEDTVIKNVDVVALFGPKERLFKLLL